MRTEGEWRGMERERGEIKLKMERVKGKESLEGSRAEWSGEGEEWAAAEGNLLFSFCFSLPVLPHATPRHHPPFSKNLTYNVGPSPSPSPAMGCRAQLPHAASFEGGQQHPGSTWLHELKYPGRKAGELT